MDASPVDDRLSDMGDRQGVTGKYKGAQGQSGMMTKAMPEAWLSVLGHRPARSLLLFLAEAARDRTRYSEVRRAMDMHPQTFSDALKDLLNAGLVFSREPVEGSRHVVYLEATHLGKFLAAHWIEEQERFAQRARKDPLVRAALTQVEAEA